MRDELGQARRVQKASCYAPGECVACAGEDWQAGPQSIACRGMCVIWQCIEKKIGEPVASQMFWGGQLSRENEPVWIDSPRGSRTPQIVLNERVGRSHSTASGISFKSRIQIEKNWGVIL